MTIQSEPLNTASCYRLQSNLNLSPHSLHAILTYLARELLREDGAPYGRAAQLVSQGELDHEGLSLADVGLQGNVPGPGRGQPEQADLEDGVSEPGDHGGGPAIAANQTPDLFRASGQNPKHRIQISITDKIICIRSP